MIYYSSLYHSGVKGMKWGVRKAAVDEAYKMVSTAKKINAERKPKAKKRDLSNVPDEDLQQAVRRYNLEKQYQEMLNYNATMSKGRQRLTRTLEVTGGILAVTSSALAVAMKIKEMKEKE